MTFEEYQKEALKFELMKPNKEKLASEPYYVAKVLGLVGEAGEVAEKYKKIIRDKSGIVNQEDRQEIIKELGDVMWYLSVLSSYLDINLSDVASQNIVKLKSRQTRNVSRGSGDNR